MKNEKTRFVGIITGTKGLKGHLILTDTAVDFTGIRNGSIVKIGFSESFTIDYHSEEVRKEGNKYLLKLKNIDSKELACELKDRAVFTNEKNIITDDRESYYIENLIGCNVYEHGNKNKIGVVKDVLSLPANDVWIVETGSGELPLPFIEDVVKKVDTENKRIEIKLIDGLLDLIDNEKAKTEK